MSAAPAAGGGPTGKAPPKQESVLRRFAHPILVFLCVAAFLQYVKPPPGSVRPRSERTLEGVPYFEDFAPRRHRSKDEAPSAAAGDAEISREISYQDHKPQRQVLRPHAVPDAPFTLVVSLDGVKDVPEEVFRDVPFSPSFEPISRSLTLDLHSCVEANRTITAKVIMSILGETYSQSFPLVKFIRARKEVKKHSLFGSSRNDSASATSDSEAAAEASHADVEDESDLPPAYKAMFQPLLTLSVVVDFSVPLSEPMIPWSIIREDRSVYLPLVYNNDFWLLQDQLVELNTTSARGVNFTILVEPFTFWKFLFHKQYTQAMERQLEVGLTNDDQIDELKRVILNTNPYFLALTVLVSALHMVFEYLAFSNDVSFWRNRKDYKGLSLHSVAVKCYFETIIFLYLLDGEETSWTILLPMVFSVLAEYWKLSKVVKLARVEGDGVGQRPAMSVAGWTVRFRHSDDAKTHSYDKRAMYYLAYIMAPLLACYTVYTAIYDTHKGWYSFIISTQVRFIYLFGFVSMTPQIFINYKMKSVTHMPWRTFVYRALNTIIDDLFAFIVTMPWMHRLACFRDDIVFAILLYQRWIYPVDSSRAEGESGETEERIDPAARVTEVGNKESGAARLSPIPAAAAEGEAPPLVEEVGGADESQREVSLEEKKKQ